ncbi:MULTISPECIES: ABC transporter permease [Enterococcus]|uniref:Iron ABC transporter permease n=1 Tax=Enterococcus mundtii TaxID=53346 RepID=A0A242KVF2_ENTMU|nr:MULTISPECIES: iron chelate uptake ABC transporter family permease subunit [Enterococcus]GEN17182.1 iron ABC transporter permease [Ligilactobacillus acidipiscis]AUB54150.1 iron ABC transporter permease [Enterococcus mundtii]MDB7086246.1 iron chelate uptake ABC transporter family permease subunit [Enterococcus mundtii]MZZ58973.1 iron chelate uptake ABC transporter family permease subunit [Enterococcus mundtii]MZZ61904.1 iron chelate uptake ABC transporter family permease subunit [Enterococcus
MRVGRLMVFLVILSICSLFIGVSRVEFMEIIRFEGQSMQLLLATRFPRTICLVLVGATSSICGLIMQHLTQNKFVSPTTAGTMDSARLGILVVMLFLPNASLWIRSATAFLFAFAGTLLFLSFARFFPQKNQLMLPLIGVMLGNIIGSAATFFAYQFQLVQNMSSWLQGNFATVMRGNYELLYVTIPLLLILSFFAYQFTIVGLGESFAVNLGMNYRNMQLLGIGLVSLASAITLIMVGTIPFLGVIIPNITAKLYGDQVHKTLGITAIFGSIFLLICDMIARLVIFPYEIPVSVIVGIIGGLIFLYLLVRGRKHG